MAPVPADALMQISGDLGNRGHLALLLDLCGPRFDLALHGLQVGNNLIKANLELGRTTDARRIVEQLYAQQRPDWREALMDWEQRIDDAEKRYGPVEGQIKIALLALDQPLWAYGLLGFEALLPVKRAHTSRVTFICGTCERAGPKATQAYVQRSEALGQVTRTFPLYLAEEVYLRTSAQTRVLFTVAEGGGFALLGAPWELEQLTNANIEADVVVLLHVDAQSSPWDMRFSLYLTSTKSIVTSWSISFTAEKPLPAVNAALERLLDELAAIFDEQPCGEPSVLQWLPEDDLTRYVSCLESALTLATVNTFESERPAVWGERALVDGLIDLAVTMPGSIRSRLLLLNSVEKEARRRPDIVREYVEKLALLQQRHPLPAGQAADLAASAMDKIRAAAIAH
jgi:hypothetical protein